MTTATTIIRHEDTDNIYIFANMMQEIFGGKVSILPNTDIANAARRQSRRKDTTIMVVDDQEGIYTAYRVGRELLMILVEDCETIDLLDLVMDEDATEELVSTFPSLTSLMKELSE